MGLVHEWHSNNREIALRVTITSPSKKRFYIVASNKGKENSKYAKREAIVEGSRIVTLSFPVTPQTMMLGIYNMADKNDANFQVEYEEVPLKTYQVWIDQQTKDFMKLNLFFSQGCGFSQASPQGRVFSTSDGEFNILYYPVIKNGLDSKPLSTPARIGHSTGNIEVAKNKFDRYTVAERVVILLHEYSHKYRNPKLGLAISNETGADINALYIYLGMGFSKIDAINVFANVFLKANTPSNVLRMRKIMDYIQKFEQGDFAQLS
jgi:hypothetical protein